MPEANGCCRIAEPLTSVTRDGPSVVVGAVCGCCSVNCDKALRAMKRGIVKPNTKIQILTLTVSGGAANCPPARLFVCRSPLVQAKCWRNLDHAPCPMPVPQLLEACVQNCVPDLHAHLATSELWAEMLKLVSDTSITRASVRIVGA